MENCIFFLNTGLNAGGIYIEKSKVFIFNSLFLENKAKNGGGIYYFSTGFLLLLLFIPHNHNILI